MLSEISTKTYMSCWLTPREHTWRLVPLSQSEQEKQRSSHFSIYALRRASFLSLSLVALLRLLCVRLFFIFIFDSASKSIILWLLPQWGLASILGSCWTWMTISRDILTVLLQNYSTGHLWCTAILLNHVLISGFSYEMQVFLEPWYVPEMHVSVHRHPSTNSDQGLTITLQQGVWSMICKFPSWSEPVLGNRKLSVCGHPTRI